MRACLSPIVAAAAATVLGACNGDTANPARLYLYLLDSELSVQLVPDEPPPF